MKVDASWTLCARVVVEVCKFVKAVFQAVFLPSSAYLLVDIASWAVLTALYLVA